MIIALLIFNVAQILNINTMNK